MHNPVLYISKHLGDKKRMEEIVTENGEYIAEPLIFLFKFYNQEFPKDFFHPEEIERACQRKAGLELIHREAEINVGGVPDPRILKKLAQG